MHRGFFLIKGLPGARTDLFIRSVYQMKRMNAARMKITAAASRTVFLGMTQGSPPE